MTAIAGEPVSFAGVDGDRDRTCDLHTLPKAAAPSATPEAIGPDLAALPPR